MLVNSLFLVLSLLFAVSMLAMLAEKLHIAYPIFLVISGLLISFVPGIPLIRLKPDIVFIIFLPPLLYSAAWNTAWNSFWFYKRPIIMLSLGLVVFTATAVAFASHALIPGFTLATGFLLGGIISPPDAVAATSIISKVKVSKRVVTVLEGESLLNDASSLIVFRFALAAIITGQFNFWEADIDFMRVVSGGIAIGLAVAVIMYLIHRYLPTTESIDTAITLIAPYLMYIIAEHYHLSGVLAVVSGGLFLSYRSHKIFSYSSRIQTMSVWNTLVFILNGMVFILIGLQLPEVVKNLGEYSLMHAIGYGIIISLVIIVIRILWVYPGAYLPRILSKKIRERETRPSWQTVFVVGWSGMRGVVSLAAGLSIPLTLNNAPFPHRSIILFITFIAILFTLVLQGLTLPFLVKFLKIESDDHDAEDEQAIRLRLATISLHHMEEHYAEESTAIEAYKRLKERYERMIENTNKKLKSHDVTVVPDFLPKYRNMLLELVAIRRDELVKMRHDKKYPDELLRDKEAELDLEEARLRK